MDIKRLDAISAYQNMAGLANKIPASSGNSTFTNMVSNAVDGSINTMKGGEIASVGAMANDVGLDDLAMAVNNAEMTLRTVVAIRDRIISAYQDILKMPI